MKSNGFTRRVSLKGQSRRPAKADDEVGRLRALDSFGILDTPPEAAFDDLTELAAHVCDAPMSMVSFVDAEREWFKSRHGIELSETSREQSFCAHAITAPGVLEVPDTWLDSRFATHHMVTGGPLVRFYAGVPLVTAEGYALGTLCVMDLEPRTLSAVQRRHLRTLANQVLSHLELRRQAQQLASEVNARLAADTALREQQRMLDGVLKHTDVLVYAKDVGGRFVMANPAVERATQLAGGLIGRTDHDFIDAEVADGYRRNDRHVMETGEWQVFSEVLVHPDGSVHTYRSTKIPLTDDDGAVIGIGGVSTDVTELAAARLAYAATEARSRVLLEQSQTAVIVVDAEGMLTYVNPGALVLCGATAADQIESRPALDLVPARTRRAAKMMLSDMLSGGPALRARLGVLRRLDGTEVTVELSATAVNHSGFMTVHCELRDVTAVAAAHAALKQFASTDPLTGLLNRNAWNARVESLIADAHYRGAPMTVAVIDLDNFKSYNDTRGHTAGDVLLHRFAAVAGASLRRSDVFARWGGEEFIIAMPATTPEQAERVLHRVRRCVPSAQCSIGYTAHTPPETLTDTVTRADKALYLAKGRGRNQLSLL